jgi:manganese efflux pump family protein
MSPLAILLVGLAMSTDAFAAAIGRGVAMRAPRFGQALRIGLIFATVETLTPALGWLLGRAASDVIEGWDHWIALLLLSGLGAHMIWEGSQSRVSEAAASDKSIWATGLAAIATSIDALAAGVGLAFLDVSIVSVAITIGLCTLVMVTLGIILGARFGTLLGKRAEVVGGIVLIGIGIGIFYQHTAA